MAFEKSRSKERGLKPKLSDDRTTHGLAEPELTLGLGRYFREWEQITPQIGLEIFFEVLP
jgi:hypothetical protein